MANDTLYVNKPGGVIVHLNDGTSHPLRYGQQVPVDQLADYVDPSGWSDDRARVSAADDPVAEAHRRAALSEGGQVGSSSSPVPGNYNELDEDAAATLVNNLAAYPEQQLAILKHEALFCGGRQKVVDAAGQYAQIQLESILHATPESFSDMGEVGGPSVSGFGDPTRGADNDAAAVARQAAASRQVAGTPGPSSGGDEFDELKGDDLKAAVEQHNAALPEDSDQRIAVSAKAGDQRAALRQAAGA